ncbi:DUF4190 domain-containing protein [Candidatus Saccharibacteria bacterium]|nr:DUF4190 domain-containing protein [Candidatus Saccharibacteria bacterium]
MDSQPQNDAAPQQPEQQAAPEVPAEQPAAPQAAPMPATQPAVATAAVNPGQGLGIGSLVCSLLGISLVGLILGIIGMKKSKEAGMSNGMALAGIIISSIGLVLGLLWFVLVVAVGVFGNSSSSY